MVDVQALIKYYDTNQDGSIGYEEFIRGLRVPLSDRRSNMTLKVFRSIEKEAGKISN